jgi:hypothetical protein
MAAAAFLLSSCATTAEKPAAEKPAAAAAQPAPAKPAAEPAKPAPAPAAAQPAPAAVKPAAEPAKPAAEPAKPAAEPAKPAPAPAPAQVGPLAVWQATGVVVTKDGKAMALPKELTSYPVYMRVLDAKNLELVVGGTSFAVPSTYTLTAKSLTINPKDYKNPPKVVIDTLGAMGIKQLPASYYFTYTVAADGTGVLEATAVGYKMTVNGKRIQ